MQITSSTIGGRNVVFDYITEDIPGGVQLDKDRLVSTIEEVEAGTPVYVDRSTRIAHIVKTSTVITGSAATTVRVAKNSHWKAGEYVSDGIKAEAIASITTSGSTYDVLNFSSGLTNYAAGTVLFETASTVMSKGSKATVQGKAGDYLYIWDSTGSSAGLKVVLAQAGDDNLAVAYSAGVLTISLANSTHTKNTVALIEAAINALITNDFPWEAFFVTEFEWDAGQQTGATITTAADFMVDTRPDLYIPNGFVKETVNVEEDNADVSVVVAGAVRNSALPFPLTTHQKALLPKITFNY